jgi:mono/diheme cytochrome c family protein
MDRRILGWVGITVAGIVVLVVFTIVMRWDRRFDAPYPELRTSRDLDVIAAGRYLAYGPGHCSDCHTAPDDYALLKTGAEPPLKGGLEFVTPTGAVRVPNITADSATGIGRRSDGEIARILRYGVRADGRAAMPFMEYHELSDSDIVRIVSFLRSRPAVTNAVADNDLNFLGKAVMAFMIRPVGPDSTPPAESPLHAPSVERGAYLVNAVSNCAGCHSERNMVTGAYTGPRLRGGSPMETSTTPSAKLIPPDLTAQPGGRLEEMSEKDFVDRFHAGERVPGSPMPWQAFRRITSDDLRSIYRYLRTVT